MKKIMSMSLTVKVLIGFVVGIALGLIFGESITVISFIGDIFLALLKMCIVPLVFFSIITGISSIADPKKLKRIGIKTLCFYIITTVCCAIVGMIVANVLTPGSGFVIESADTAGYEATAVPSVTETLVSMFPTNIVTSLSDTSLIQIIIFCAFVGIAITLVGEKADPVRKLCASASEVMFKIVSLVMEFSPIGTCALIACTFGEYGLDILLSVFQVLVAHYLAMAIVLFLVYGLLLYIIAKVNIFKFLKEISEVLIVTVSTCSSAATLPISIDTAVKKLKIKRELAEFSLPLGSTINLDGGVIYYCMCFMFVSQVYQVDVSLTQMIFIVFTATFLAVGAPGMPGGGIMMVMILLSTMGLPLDLMGIISGTNRLFDMGNTALNCTGDLVCTRCIAESEHMMIEDSAEVEVAV